MIHRQVRAGKNFRPLLENDLDFPELGRETLSNHLIAREIAVPVLREAETLSLSEYAQIARRLVKQAIAEGLPAEEITSFFQGKKSPAPWALNAGSLFEEFQEEFSSTRIGDECKSSKNHLANRISRLVYLTEEGDELVKAKNRLTLLREKVTKAAEKV